MVFDERDIDEQTTKKDEKEKIVPLKEQMSFDDVVDKKQEEPKKEITKKPVARKTAVKPLVEEVEVEKVQMELEASSDDELEETSEEEDANSFVEEQQELILDEFGNINKGLRQVIHESMMPYSEYVILDRALPRVEDGLKPVQRRILYSMYELGLTPDKPFKKSAKVVGDCMANYHPHGDSSVYNAMVRMSQAFNMNEILIKGHGNFGSMDGDSPAAMRYTEAKLSEIAIELLKDIEKETVRFSPNYDDSKKEPDILPGRFPNLLVNGSSGIAVGLATNIPPHNLGETIDAVVAYIEDKKISLKDLMGYIKGPDFPMGGIILGTDGIEEAYRTGKGKIILRAKTHIETEGGKKTIVVDEFPYQVNKASLLQKIASLREENKDLLSGIAEIRDESDRNGVRAAIYLKKDVDDEIILNYLFKNTDLQISFAINMVAIAGGKPKQLGLIDILEYYSEYQREVVLNRTKFDLDTAKKRAHIIEGLLIAIKNIDEVIKIIKASASTVEAKSTLRERFKLSDKQAQAVLDMRLSRLTNLEVGRLEEELKELLSLIEKLTAIVASRARQMSIVKKELLEVKKAYATKRRTKIIEDASELLDLNEADFTPVKEVIIAFNEKGCIKKIPQKSFAMTARLITDKSTLNEVHSIVLATESDKELILFTDRGNCHRLNLDPVLETKWKDRGSKLNELIKNFEPDENVVAAFPVSTKFPKKELIFFTKDGIVKKSEFSEYDVKKTSFEALKLKEGDVLINVEVFDKDKTLTFVTKEGMILNAVNEEVPTQNRLSGGVKGIKLNDSDYVICGCMTTRDDVVAIITTKGYAKKIEINENAPMAKYRKGIKAVTLGMDNGFDLLYASKVEHTFEIYIINDKGKIISLNTDYMPVESRLTKGKLITPSKKPIKIKHIYKYEWEPITYSYNKK
ncbi:MAG: DNA topoisomerase (ATP-hydrolyzing) subunit A [Spirochaetales bacterium]